MHESGGVLDLRLERVTAGKTGVITELPPGEYVRLTVSDTGHGMSPETLDHIFEPYFTTRVTGDGTGLGLAMVHGIVKDHGGEISVQSEEGQGSTFSILLPLMDREASVDRPVQRSLGVTPAGTERILFVDDEEPIVRMSKFGLERLGYVVEAKTSSVEALEAFRTAADGFDVVVTDLTLPKMNGAELACEIRKIRPDCPIILCAGYSDVINEAQARTMGID
jgi:CheY-like chemotaxis protein